MCNSVITLNKVNCKVGHRYLLKDIHWNVCRGDRWVVFGMNGSGKTTLLSIIAGFKHYTSGSITVFGQSLTNENVLALRKKIGWVSSSFFDKYYSQESALNIVLSGLTGTLGLDESITLSDCRLAKQLLTKLGLGDSLNNTFDMFSKGERQNILIARALINHPEILILDEPCSGLDIYNRNYLFNTIEKLSQNPNLTIIYVTHYIEEILPLFDKILLLKNGHVFHQGSIENTFTSSIMSALLDYPVVLSPHNSSKHALQINVDSDLTSLLY